ncbi:MAG: AAA family ATPase [Nanoarchaeota archaeon]|nr:AAA family ATPase [Nanoarchaeota archaeon]
MSQAKVIGVIAIKGGVGKTTTVANLGAILANNFMKKVLVVDANFSAPNLGLHLGIVKPESTVHDVLAEKVDIRKAIIQHEFGFDVLPASLVPKKINPYKLRNRLEKVKGDYDYILLDSSPTLNEEILSTMIASDELVVVTTPDYPTLSTTMHAVSVAKKKKTPIAGLILNKVRNKRFELRLEDIENATGVPILAVLPDDIKVLESLSNTMPVALQTPKGDATVEYKKLAAALAGENYADPRLLHNMRRMFSKTQSKVELNRETFTEQRKK